MDDDEVAPHLNARRTAAALRGVVWSTLGSVMPTAVNAAVFLVTSRYLGPAEIGVVVLATAVVGFASGLCPTAFSDALVQQKSIRRAHLDSVFWMNACVSAVVFGVLVVGSSVLGGILAQPRLAYLLPVIAIRLPLDSLAAVPTAVLTRSMSFHLLAVRTAVASLISGALCLALVLTGFGIWALVAAQLASSIIQCGAAFWSSRWRPGAEFRCGALRDLAPYGAFASLNRFLQVMSVDQIILGAFAGTQSLGILNFARRIYQMILDVISGGLNSVSHTLFSSLQGETAKIREAFLTATFLSSIVAFPIYLGLALVADPAVVLAFGPQWASAVWPVRGFCVIGAMASIGIIQSTLITSQGGASWWFYYQLVRAIGTVLAVLLFWRFSLDVIVLALVAQVLVTWPFAIAKSARLAGITPREYFRQFLEPAIGIAALAAATLLSGYWLRDMPATLQLGIAVASGAAAYLLVLLATCRLRLSAIVRQMRRNA